MTTSKEFRQQADVCLKLASEAADVFVTAALTELAADFRETADRIERASGDATIDDRQSYGMRSG